MIPDITMEYDEITENILVICKEADLAFGIVSSSTPEDIARNYNELKRVCAEKLAKQ